MRAVAFLFAAVLAGSACSATDAPVQPVKADSLPEDKPATPRLSVLILGGAAFEGAISVGDTLLLPVLGFDQYSHAVATGGAMITVSDPDAAQASLLPVQIQEETRTRTDGIVAVRFNKAGVVGITATLDSMSSTVNVDVVPADSSNGSRRARTWRDRRP